MKESIKKSGITDEQLNDLLRENAFSRRIADLIKQLNELSGIHYSVRDVLLTIAKSLDGSNVRIYYQIDNTLFYADAQTGQSVCDQIGDFNVVAVFKTGEIRSSLSGITDAHRPTENQSVTWFFPLRTGSKVVGVCEMVDVEMSSFEIKQFSDLFLNYLAILLNNEIANFIRHRKDEEALRLSNDLLTTFIQQSPIYTYIKEVTPTESRVLKASENFLDMVGIPGSQMIGKTMQELFPPGFAEAVTADDWDVASQNRMILKEEELNGRYYITYKYPIRDGARNLLAGYTIDLTAQRQAEELLRQNEERFSLLLNSAAEAIYSIDLKGICTFCNSACLQMLGYHTANELLGKNMHAQIHSKYADGSYFDVHDCRIYKAFLSGTNSHVDDEVLWRADGSCFPAEYWSYPQRQNGKVIGAVVTFIDISERKQAEEKIMKANRLYAVISQVNQAIVHQKDKDHLLEEVCRIAIDFGKFRMAWVGIIDDATQQVVPVCVAGFDEGYLSDIKKISVSDKPEGRGPVGSAIRNGQHYVCNDIDNDPDFEIWHNEATKRGYRSLISLPIRLHGQVIGAFSLYSGITNFFDDEEVKLLEEVAYDISFALGAIETEKEHREAVIALAESENKFRTIVNSTSEAIFIHDAKTGVVIDYNLAAQEMFDLHECESYNSIIEKISLEDEGFTLEKTIEKILSVNEQGELTCEWKLRKKNNVGFWCEVSLKKTVIDGCDRIIAVVRDISERRNLVQSVLESEERHRLMFETSQETIVIIQHGRLVYFNPKLTELTGYTEEEIDEMDFLQFIHPEDRDRVKWNYESRITGKDTEEHYQFRVLQKNGGIRWVNISGSLLQWNGIPAGFYFLSDVTDLKLSEHQANERMKELNAFYRLGELTENRMFSLEEFYLEFVDILPGSWQYPEITCSCIRVFGKEYKTKNYSANCRWVQSATIMVNDQIAGSIEVGYLEECPASDEGPFMYEERLLVNGLAERLGHIIERKLTEEQLRLMKTVVENSPSVLFRWKATEGWPVDYVSDNVEKQFGYTSEELKSGSVHFDDLIYPADQERVEKEIHDFATQSVDAFRQEYRIVTRGGTIRWVDDRSMIIRNEQGEIIFYEGILLDQTEQKQAEEMLRQSEEKYRLITENASDVIWVLNLNQWRFSYISPAVFQLRGFMAEEAMAESIEHTMTPESLLKVNKAIEENLSVFLASSDRSDYYIVEIQQYCKDGSLIWVEVSAKLRVNSLGEVEVIGVSRDIQERKKLEDTIKDNEQKFRLLFENSPLGIYIADVDGNIIDGNHSLLAILGSPSIEMTKQINVLNFPPLIENGYAELFRNCIKENRILIAEMPYVSRWGKQTYLSSYLVPLRNASGEVDKVYTLMEDITKRKQAEEALIASETDLLEANATKDKFFSIIAHDLRSPLATLMSFSELMADDSSRLSVDEYQHYSKALFKTASSTFHLLENLLVWSRLQRGSVSFNPQPIKLLDFLNKVEELALEMASKKSIKIETFPVLDIQIMADLDMLHSVLRNLVTNAIKFTPKGGVIKVRVEEDLSGNILFSVQDSGIGMDAERMNNLFRIDTNVSRPGTDGEPSTGLGLILCKEFVEKHGGKIWAESDPDGYRGDKGSTFYFTLPKK